MNMSLPILKYCDNKHIYDAAIYDTCPYCKKEKERRAGLEAGIQGPGGTYNTGVEDPSLQQSGFSSGSSSSPYAPESEVSPLPYGPGSESSLLPYGPGSESSPLPYGSEAESSPMPYGSGTGYSPSPYSPYSEEDEEDDNTVLLDSEQKTKSSPLPYSAGTGTSSSPYSAGTGTSSSPYSVGTGTSSSPYSAGSGSTSSPYDAGSGYSSSPYSTGTGYSTSPYSPNSEEEDEDDNTVLLEGEEETKPSPLPYRPGRVPYSAGSESSPLPYSVGTGSAPSTLLHSESEDNTGAAQSSYVQNTAAQRESASNTANQNIVSQSEGTGGLDSHNTDHNTDAPYPASQSAEPRKPASQSTETRNPASQSAGIREEEETSDKRVIGWLVCTSMRKEYGRSIEICEGDNIICFDGRSLRSRPKMESGMRVYGRIIYYEPYKKFVFQKYPKETGSINGQMLNTSTYLSAFDRISIGDVDLIFVPLIGDRFSWE